MELETLQKANSLEAEIAKLEKEKHNINVQVRPGEVHTAYEHSHLALQWGSGSGYRLDQEFCVISTREFIELYLLRIDNKILALKKEISEL